MVVTQQTDVAIIGAGPSGAIAASLLVQQGYRVTVLEKELFPRFSIGESLLPHCMEIIEQAGMLEVLEKNAAELGFQFKNGAAFYRDGETSNFDFSDKFTPGPGTTFQVKRAPFDKLLADRAQEIGADIRYQHEVNAVSFSSDEAILNVTCAEQEYQLKAKFLLDASGFGRVLPRLLNLELPSSLSNRRSIFCHVKDNISSKSFDRNKILITVHPTIADVWYWLIPFSDGTASCGVVGEVSVFDESMSEQAIFDSFIAQDKNLSTLLANRESINEVRSIRGYSADVTALYGDKFALLGNAGEFLDPVFSSGVTIAMHSAELAAQLVGKQLSGQQVDWQSEYNDELRKGVEVFKHFVTSWYDTRLQDVIFFNDKNSDVKPLICSILAGYAWDEKNPFVKKTERGLKILVQLCEAEPV